MKHIYDVFDSDCVDRPVCVPVMILYNFQRLRVAKSAQRLRIRVLFALLRPK